MSSLVSVNTYAHSVVFVTDKMLSSLKQMIVGIGLSPAKFVSDWSVNERGVQTWLASQDLVEAYLEITSSTGAFVTRCDFTIDYTYGNGEGNMWVDSDAVRNSITKLGKIPAECGYRFILRTKAGAPDVAGWGDADMLPTTGFVKQSLGTTIGTNSIGAQTAYWRKAL